jgi:D-3-phosphoglycerate dehydrogenase / 2-oxoglutarate reductase
MKKILITAPAHPVLRETLTEKGFSVAEEPAITYEELFDKIQDIEGLVVTTRLPINRPLIEKAARLRWIGRLGSGMELIDVQAASEKGLTCISTPEGNSNAVAEHTLALLLNGLNHVARAYNEVRRGIWLRNENRGTELAGKTVGIIGYGHTGSSFGKLLQPFGVRVLAVDKYKKNFAGGYVYEATMEDIFREADVLSLHLPLTDETRGMANEAFFNSLQRKPFFISTCRGKVTDTEALIAALQAGKISGAALDVLENEKLDKLTEQQQRHFNWLVDQPNVLLTPHIAGYTFEGFRRMSAILLQKLETLHFI